MNRNDKSTDRTAGCSIAHVSWIAHAFCQWLLVLAGCIGIADIHLQTGHFCSRRINLHRRINVPFSILSLVRVYPLGNFMTILSIGISWSAHAQFLFREYIKIISSLCSFQFTDNNSQINVLFKNFQ